MGDEETQYWKEKARSDKDAKLVTYGLMLGSIAIIGIAIMDAKLSVWTFVFAGIVGGFGLLRHLVVRSRSR